MKTPARQVRTFVMGVAIATLFAATSFAQTTSGFSSKTKSNSSSGASAIAIAPAATGGSTTIPNQAPPVYAPNIVTANPCVVGASAGVTTPLVGVAIGVGSTDIVCQLHMIGMDRVAFELLCLTTAKLPEAARLARVPCASDRPPGTPAGVVVPEAQVQVAVPQVVQKVEVAPPSRTSAPLSLRPDAPAYCRSKDLHLETYPDCTTPSKS